MRIVAHARTRGAAPARPRRRARRSSAASRSRCRAPARPRRRPPVRSAAPSLPTRCAGRPTGRCPTGCARPDLGNRRVERQDLGVHRQLAQPARDQLRELRSEVENDDGLVSHGGTKRYYKVWRRPTPLHLVGHLLSARCLTAGRCSARWRRPTSVQPPRLPIAIKLVRRAGNRRCQRARSATAIASSWRFDRRTSSRAIVADGRELWRIQKEVSTPFAAADGLVFVSAGDAIEALRAADGASAWLVPRVKAVGAAGCRRAAACSPSPPPRSSRSAPQRRRKSSGADAAGGVRLRAGHRRRLASTPARTTGGSWRWTLATGRRRWEEYVPGGVTALAAHRGRVYAGAGDKQLLLPRRDATARQRGRSASAPLVTGRIAVDDERVYFAALDNVIRALDRIDGQPAVEDAAARGGRSPAFACSGTSCSCRWPAPSW